MLVVAVCSCALLSLAAAQQEEVNRYLARYGYPAKLELATRQFQQLAGLPATGQSDPATIEQMELPRCGAPDQGADRTGGAGVRTYSVTQYPPPQSPSIDRQHIDTVLATAANLWNKDGVRLVKNEIADRSDIELVFCPLSSCLPNHSAEQLARPVYNSTTGRLTIYLDSQQAWADETELAALSYGALQLHTQLLQVALHQFGHALGLVHSSRPGSAMFPFYTEWVVRAEVKPDPGDWERLPTAGHSGVPSPAGLHPTFLIASTATAVLQLYRFF